ncbi:MAG: HNH endonuclease signature motif containing protein, partial [Ilumatobacteraceae bacterium]
AHNGRRAQVGVVGNECFLDAQGAATAGVQLKEILDAFAHSEWLADWGEGVLQHGEGMCPGLLSRTDAQRRFDALLAIFHAAAGMSGDATGTAVTVNLVVGLDVFERHLEEALGGEPAPLDPNDPFTSCETDSGVVIDPYDLLIAAATGHVRRVVLDSTGVVVDMGRKQRLFTGAMREAVLLSGRRCLWPGCNVPAHACQADHVLPWSQAGPTRTANGAPVCGHHNRWKSRGYRTRRDPDGHWHHYRPDGTEIGWRAEQGHLMPA